MAVVSEIQSLEEISYKSKIKVYLWPFIIILLLLLGFLNFYPVGEKIKSVLQSQLRTSGCNLDYKEAGFELFFPKLVITDLTVPARCLGRSGDPLEFSTVKINFQFISFSPFGLPFRLDTEVNRQPVSLYFVQGLSERLLRLKDQTFDLEKLAPIIGEQVKLDGKVTMDFKTLLSNQNLLKSLSLKAQSKDFVIPPQSIEGFMTPKMKVNDLYLEVEADTPSQIEVTKLIIGDPDSPMRANFKGSLGLQQGNIPMSQLNLTGEVAFSKTFKETVPIVDMFLGQFTQKDGFYQIRIGGILAAPKLFTP